MYYTEEKASGNFCPQDIHIRAEGGVITRGMCQGSRCMAWRWDSKQTPDDVGETWQKWEDGRSSKRQGYCGLAGKP